jgi:hypothetical protein
MPYAEVKSYAQLQDIQQTFAHYSGRLTDAYTPAIAYLYSFRDDRPSRNAVAGSEPHSTAPAADIAKTVTEGRRIALNIQSELLLCEATAKELQREYGEALVRNPC